MFIELVNILRVSMAEEKLNTEIPVEQDGAPEPVMNGNNEASETSSTLEKDEDGSQKDEDNGKGDEFL